MPMRLQAGGRQPMGPADRPILVPELSAREADFVAAGPRVDPDLVVGVVDTGIVLDDGHPHPFLAGHLAGEPADYADLRAEDDLYRGHGSFVAGRILLEAPTATIDMRRVLLGAGDRQADNDAAVAAAIRALAADNGNRLAVVNLSFAGHWEERSGPTEIAAALAALGDVPVVAATANRWDDRPSWPAAFSSDPGSNVLAVGAVDETVLPEAPLAFSLTEPTASFASRWSGITVYGSAVRVLGPRLTGGWCRWSGTSFAAASVSGILARLGARAGTWADLIGHVPMVEDKPWLRSAEAIEFEHTGGGHAG
ncbi:MAG TPA: S8/S53 family peptidase [Mycobacteriales bacterium]|nr:S8/S53 family peptidase [Mycobacteriales bacterium]